jgi:hypothetical protein
VTHRVERPDATGRTSTSTAAGVTGARRFGETPKELFTARRAASVRIVSVAGDDEIENLDTGRCAAYSSLANGAPLIQTLCGFVVGSEFWKLSHLGTDGAYQTYSFRVSLSNYCMDLENGSTSDGVPLQVWTCNPNTNNQKWDLYAT